jgi:hypothetical protein
VNKAQEKYLSSNPLCGRCKSMPHNPKHKWCKPCQSEYYQDRCKVPGYREKLAVKSSVWRNENRELFRKIVRNNNLKRSFGITIEQYEEMHAAQKGLCKICGLPESTVSRHGKIQRLAVDHCHKTMANRGLLCGKCNHAIERIENIPDWAAKVRAYLDAL